MQVTSDTLFHFTTSLNNLKNILSKKFMLTYCHEEYSLDKEKFDEYFPMISFCDIPLHLVKAQIERYGSYSIGLTKEWGIKNGLNPIVYIEKDSLLANDIISTIYSLIAMGSPIKTQANELKSSLEKISKKIVDLKLSINNSSLFSNNDLEKIIKLKSSSRVLTSEETTLLNSELQALREKLSSYNNELQENQKNLKENQKNLEGINSTFKELKELVSTFGKIAHHSFNLFRYIKNYEGTLIRNEKIFNNYRFYDEREWRYVPALSDNRVKISLNVNQFNEYRGTHKKKPFIDGINLSFTGNDIKYLIVKSNKDIPKLINAIKTIDNLTTNSNESDVLTTRILTVEQLDEDF